MHRVGGRAETPGSLSDVAVPLTSYSVSLLVVAGDIKIAHNPWWSPAVLVEPLEKKSVARVTTEYGPDGGLALTGHQQSQTEDSQ